MVSAQGVEEDPAPGLLEQWPDYDSFGSSGVAA
jgi:hypothetical protein